MLETIKTESISDDQSEIDIRHYLFLAWHWSWLIALVTLITAAISFFVSSQMTPVYEASTKVLVMEAPSTKNTDYNSVLASQSLTKTYSDMMTSDSVIKEVIKRLNLVIDPKDLVETIEVTPVTNTQLIEITVNDINPVMAANIANMIVEVFIDQIETIQSARFSTSRESLKNQLTEMEKQLQDVNQQKALTTSQSELDRLETKAMQYQQLYATLLTSYEQARLADIQASVNIVQVSDAQPESKPIKPNILFNTLLAGVIGMVLTVGGLLIMDVMDDTIKTPDEILNKLGLPVLGVIYQHKIKDQPIAIEEPRSPISEAFRSLRTNILYANVDNPIRTLLITSPSPGEGKTTIGANLAVVFANNGKNVCYVDADMRQPTVHEKLDIPNNSGLLHFILHPDISTKIVSQSGKVNGLSVITSGDLPPNPAELLGSKKMGSIIERLRSEADLVIFDTPPILAVSDPAVLASAMDAVLLVIRPGKTTFHAAHLAIEQLLQVNAKVIGVVLNNVKTRGHSYGYYYHRGYDSQKYYGKNVDAKTKQVLPLKS